MKLKQKKSDCDFMTVNYISETRKESELINDKILIRKKLPSLKCYQINVISDLNQKRHVNNFPFD